MQPADRRNDRCIPVRLNRNAEGYLGEKLDSVDDYLEAIQKAACSLNFSVSWLEDKVQHPNLKLLWLRRETSTNQPWVYISSGVHGDEPAGPLTLLSWMQEGVLPEDLNYDIFPCLNPWGLNVGSRLTATGIDLNRDYKSRLTPEAQLHHQWFQSWKNNPPKYQASICIHEDWESEGFYLYEVNPGNLPSHGDFIIEEVAKTFPVETGPMVDGMPAQHGVIRPQENLESREEWPEAIYMILNRFSLRNYTFETSSDYSLTSRVSAHCIALTALMERLRLESGIL